MKLRRILTLFVAAFSVLAVSAQRPKDAHKFYKFVNLPDSMAVYQAIYSNTPLESEFMLVPKFAIVGFNNQFLFSVGASMKFTASYDWGNPVRKTNEMGLAQISPALDGEKKLFQMGASGSGVYFNIIGFPNTANQVGLFVSFCLDKDSDNKYTVSTGHIYLRYRGFQAGFTSSLYNEPVADTYTIDENGPCSSGSHSVIGVNYRHNFTHWYLGGGVEVPKSANSVTQIVPEGYTPAEVKNRARLNTQTTPDFPLYVGYRFNDGHVRLSGIIRRLHYVDYQVGNGRSELGYGVKLTTTFDIHNFRFYGMTQYGKGIANYLKDNSGEGLDLVPVDNEPLGTLKPTSSFGFLVAAQYYFTSRLFTGFQYSFMRNYIPKYSMEATTSWGSQLRRGYTITANLIWKISPIFNVGIEYLYGNRTDESYQNLHNNRAYAMLFVNF